MTDCRPVWRRNVGALCLLVCAIRAPAQSTEVTGSSERLVRVHLEVEPASGSSQSVSGRISISPAASTGQPWSRAATFDLTPPGDVSVAVPIDSSYLVQVAASGYFAADEVVVPPQAGALAARVMLFRTTTLRARLEPPLRVSPETELTVRLTRLRPPARAASKTALTSAEESGTLSGPFERRCVVAAESVSCEVPVGRWDLRFRIPGYIPVYCWDVALGLDQPAAIAPLAFKKGSSVVGRVEARDGDLAPTCRAELSIPVPPGSPASPTTQQISRMTRTTPVNGRGFFQFEGIPPGRYDLEVSQTGMAPARVEGVVVLDGLESEIAQRLILSPALSASFQIEPPSSPLGTRMSVRLVAERSAGGPSRGSWRASVNPSNGHAEIRGLPAGRYDLSIESEEGTRWWTEEVEVLAPGTRLPIRIPLVEVEGDAKVGDEPISGFLWFGGRHGSRRVRLVSDEHGRFAGQLPEASSWLIELLGRDGLSLTLDDVPVTPTEPGHARMEVRVPAIRVEGSVVDEAGRPIPGAEVSSSGRPRSSATTDVEGKFSLRGLHPGFVSITARKEGLESEPQPLTLGDEPAPQLTLRLKDATSVRGTVRHRGSPLAGARVLAWSAAGGRVAQTVSGPDGAFRLRLGGGAKVLQLTVIGSGLPAHMERVSIPADGEVHLALDLPGGWLVLDGVRQAAAQLDCGGVRAPVLFLRQLLGVMTGKLYVEAGFYRVCVPGATAVSPEVCASGTVLPGQELPLVLPEAGATRP